jgi:hypothetical protein
VEAQASLLASNRALTLTLCPAVSACLSFLGSASSEFAQLNQLMASIHSSSAFAEATHEATSATTHAQAQNAGPAIDEESGLVRCIA